MTFDELLATDYKNPTVAIFYGLNCPPCERLKPKLKAICSAAGVRLETFNSAAELPAIRNLGLRSVPAVVAVLGGKTTVCFTGDLPEQEILQRLRAAGVRHDV